MNAQVRKAGEHDLSRLLAWVRAFHLHHAIPEPKGGLTNAITHLLTDAKLGSIRIVEVGASLQQVGYIAMCYGYSIEFGGRDAFVDEMFLEPHVRGQGHGRAALEQVITRTRAEGIRALHLHLEVAEDNAPAERFYAPLGFEKRSGYRLMTLLLTDGRS